MARKNIEFQLIFLLLSTLKKLRTKHQGQSIDVCKGINLTERQ